MTKSLMIQGTGSHVGKSIIVTALCRILKQKGLRVAPFKAQNMALNSFVTSDGGEIGRAQAVQAEAAGIEPTVDMNPVLIKPQTDIGAQVIIHGKVLGHYSAVEYHHYKKKAIRAVIESYRRLAEQYDFIVIEGAGSPAEINLKKNDIVNMRVAHLADAPVLLVSDIDRGGVFASLVGTMELLTETEKMRVKGFLINKFRGDPSLLRSGLQFLEKKTGVKVFGVIPFFRDIHIQDEDSISLESKMSAFDPEALDIAVIRLPHISNFTDFDPLEREETVRLRYVSTTDELKNPDLLIIPGSKNTTADLRYLKNRGFVKAIKNLRKAGTTIVGICGGFQMLGKTIKDPQEVDGSINYIKGLHLLDVETQFVEKKATFQVEAEQSSALNGRKSKYLLRGYEIHMGRTKRNAERSIFRIKKRSGKKCVAYDGAISKDGRVWGTYIHGIFDNDGFRNQLLQSIHAKRRNSHPIKGKSTSYNYSSFKEVQYDKLADVLKTSVKMNLIYRLL